MKRALTLLIIALLTCSCIYAQQRPAQPSQERRQKWFSEMTQYKHDFISKELILTKEQEARFFPLYDKMESETRSLNRQARELEKAVIAKGDRASDLEYEKAAEALYELKGKENDIEMKYFAQFKSVLTQKQLFQLKQAERKFNSTIMSQQRGQTGPGHHNRDSRPQRK
jgi:Spy/CpxP family protein refolding chaperone